MCSRVGCFASAAAPTLSVLLAGRVVTGIGAALVMPATLSLLLQVTPAPNAKAARDRDLDRCDRRTRALLARSGGGIILQWLPWQGLFLVIGSLAPVLAVAVMRVAPRG